jgi:hypothetical protein
MARGIKEAIYTRALYPDLNRGGDLHYILPPTYDTLINTTICPPKPPPPSASGSPPPTFNINLPKPKDRQPGAQNLIKCLPIVDAAIAKAAAVTPTGAPQTPQPTPTVTRRPGRPHKNNPTTTAGIPPTAAVALTLNQAPSTHVMTTRAGTLQNVDRDALASSPATGVFNPRQKN